VGRQVLKNIAHHKITHIMHSLVDNLSKRWRIQKVILNN